MYVTILGAGLKREQLDGSNNTIIVLPNKIFVSDCSIRLQTKNATPVISRPVNFQWADISACTIAVYIVSKQHHTK